MVTVNVSREILLWVAERSGKHQKIESDFPKWHEWIEGESQPTFRQVEKLANLTSTPLGYFFLHKAPIENLPIPHYRTISRNEIDTPSPNLLETVYTMKRRQDWMHEYLVSQKYDQLYFIGTKNINDDPISIAQEIKSTLGLENGWAANIRTWKDALRLLFQKIDLASILLVVNGIVGNNTHRQLDVNEFRGFVLIDEYAPLIFVNGADGKAAQMFTIAHELAHIWFGHSAAFDLHNLHPANNEIENACNKVAAEFLVPQEELLEVWPRDTNRVNVFQNLARHFKVSEIVAARRALDLSLITRDQFFEFYNNRLNYESENSSSGGNFYATQNFRIGRRFAEAVISATYEGRLLYNEAYRLTGLKGNTFSEFASRLGFGGDV